MVPRRTVGGKWAEMRLENVVAAGMAAGGPDRRAGHPGEVNTWLRYPRGGVWHKPGLQGLVRIRGWRTFDWGEWYYTSMNIVFIVCTPFLLIVFCGCFRGFVTFNPSSLVLFQPFWMVGPVNVGVFATADNCG